MDVRWRTGTSNSNPQAQLTQVYIANNDQAVGALCLEALAKAKHVYLNEVVHVQNNQWTQILTILPLYRWTFPMCEPDPPSQTRSKLPEFWRYLMENSAS